jgi:hypothetical protein
VLILFEELKNKQGEKAKFRFKPLLAFDATTYNLDQLHLLFSRQLSDKESVIALKRFLSSPDNEHFYDVADEFLHTSNNYKGYPILQEIQKWGFKIISDLKGENLCRNFAYSITSGEQNKKLEYQELQVNYRSLQNTSRFSLGDLELPHFDSSRRVRESDKNLILFYFESESPYHQKSVQAKLVKYSELYSELWTKEREGSIQTARKIKVKVARIQNRTIRKRRMKYSTMAGWVVRGFERYEYLKVKDEQDYIRENYSGVKSKGFNRTINRFKRRDLQESWDISNRRRSTNWKECTKRKKQYKE